MIYSNKCFFKSRNTPQLHCPESFSRSIYSWSWFKARNAESPERKPNWWFVIMLVAS